MTAQERVRDVLQSLPLERPEIYVVPAESGRLIATVVSESFDGMDEAERQERVWDAMLRQMTPLERSGVEFVFTISPHDPGGFADNPEEAAAGN
jgi:hypothetical protein